MRRNDCDIWPSPDGLPVVMTERPKPQDICIETVRNRFFQPGKEIMGKEVEALQDKYLSNAGRKGGNSEIIICYFS